MLRFDTPTAYLRSVAFLEGISYLILLACMPLKYWAGQPTPVRIAGSLHGLLFVWLMLLVLQGLTIHSRKFGWAVRIGIASLIPFGLFFMDARLRREDEEFREAKRASRP